MSFINPQVRIKFLKNFTSPVFGNVWETRELTCDKAIAKKFIDNGYAEEIKAKAKVKEEVTKPEAVKRGRPVKTEETLEEDLV